LGLVRPMNLDYSTPSAQEFHRRRAESEMEKALVAGPMSVSLSHLELAKIHRQRRDELIANDRARTAANPPSRIYRTDKEG